MTPMTMMAAGSALQHQDRKEDPMPNLTEPAALDRWQRANADLIREAEQAHVLGDELARMRHERDAYRETYHALLRGLAWAAAAIAACFVAAVVVTALLVWLA